MEYQKPIKKYEYDYDGQMCHVKTTQVDLLVTPNHKFFMAKRQRNGTWKWRFEEIAHNLTSTFKVPKTGLWKGREPEFIKIGNKKVKAEDACRFLGYYLAEGYVDHNPVNGNYTVSLCQNKENLRKFKEALEKVTDNKVFIVEDRKASVRDRNLWEFCKQFGYAHEKYIPKEFKDLSPRLLRILIESFAEGDGDKFGRLYTSSERLRDDLQEIIIKAGYASNYYLMHRKGYKGNFGSSNYNNWAVTVGKRSKQHTVNKNKQTISIEQYQGKVYCLQVPNHIMLVRRNGKAVFCGNSGYGKVTKYVTQGFTELGYRVVISAYYGVEPGQLIRLKENLLLVGSKIGPFGVHSSKMYADMFKADVSILMTDWWAFPLFPKLHKGIFFILQWTLKTMIQKHMLLLKNTGR